jgi:hypothetical protein
VMWRRHQQEKSLTLSMQDLFEWKIGWAAAEIIGMS